MALRIRLFGKKRGDRRTGSERLGSYGEALFFSVFLAIGAVGLYLLLAQLLWPQWCVVLRKGIGETQVQGVAQFRPEIEVQYEVAGEMRRAQTSKINYDVPYYQSLGEAEELLAKIEVGERYRCWVDPQQSDNVVLVLGRNWWLWLLLIAPVSFMVLGAVGAGRALLQTGASAERRAALAKAAQLDLFEEQPADGAAHPTLPYALPVRESSGTRLAYRLPGDTAQSWSLIGMLLMCLVWNGIVVSFLIAVAREWQVENSRWWIGTLVLVPFAVAGIALLVLAARRVFQTVSMGSTRLEVSAHPLFPGRSYELFISQTGAMRINSLQIALVCDEEATFRQGTDTRTERQRVHAQPIYERREIRIEAGKDWDDTCRFELPAGVMHSFQAVHNEIKWKLVVTGDIAHRAGYERQFPIVVYPSPAPGVTSEPDPR